MANKPLSGSGADVATAMAKKHSRIGTTDAIKQILRLHGVRGLYTGFPLHLARDSIGTGLYFGIYESTKQAMVAYQGANNPVAAGPVAIAGGLCGVVSWICVSTWPASATRSFLLHLIHWSLEFSSISTNYNLDLPPRHQEDACAEHPPRQHQRLPRHRIRDLPINRRLQRP
jgi:hypothetical protein